MTGAQTLRRAGAVAMAVGLALAAGSCNEIVGPLRPAGYGYTLIVSDVVDTNQVIDGVSYTAGDTITDTVDFNWPQSSLPIRVWVEDTLGLPGHLRAAIGLWTQQLIYGEVAATLTSDSAHADIILRGIPAPMTAPAAPARLLAAPVACEGATDVRVSYLSHNRVWLPIRMYVTPKYPMDDPATVPCLARVTAHELGHALGLFQHSPNSTDLMASFPSVDAPSDVDAATVQWVYHQPVDLRPEFPPPPADTTAAPVVAHTVRSH